MDDWTWLRDETPTARKQYKCFLCQLLIEPGSKHVMRTGVHDGSVVSSRMHAECEAKTKLWDEYDWMTHDPSDFRRYELEMSDAD
jgi:hypothetical protein